MRFPRLVIGGVLLATGSAFAASDYVSEVQKAYAPRAEIKRVAMIPLQCPTTLDCAELEATVIKRFGKRTQLEFVSPQELRNVMVSAGIEKLDYESRYILAESLRIDGFVELDIKQAVVETHEGEKVAVGITQMSRGTISSKHVKMVLSLTAKDGSAILQGSGEAHVTGGLKSLDGVAERTFDTVLEQAVPEQ